MSKLFRSIAKTVYNARRGIQSNPNMLSFADRVEYGYRFRGYLALTAKESCGHHKFRGYIPTEQLTVIYTNCMGPGANVVTIEDAKVEVGFQVSSAMWIKDTTIRRLLEKYQDELTKDGFLFFKSNATKSQFLNHADCMEQIRTCITEIERDELSLPRTEPKKGSMTN